MAPVCFSVGKTGPLGDLWTDAERCLGSTLRTAQMHGGKDLPTPTERGPPDSRRVCPQLMAASDALSIFLLSHVHWADSVLQNLLAFLKGGGDSDLSSPVCFSFK